MTDFRISVEQYSGTYYDIGYKQGQQIDKPLINMFANIVNEDRIDLDRLNEIYAWFSPHLLEELSGLADSMDIPLKRAALFSGYGTPEMPGMGCSSIVNRKMLVRNYDYSPAVYDGRFVFIQPNKGYASVGHSLHVMGRTEGVNEKGLAIALHFVNNKEAQNGLTAGSVIRIVLDTCKNTDEAINMIKQLPHSWSYNFAIGDAKGNTAIVEESPFNIKVRTDEHTLYCTNHFQNDSMLKSNRENLEGSMGRLNYLSRNNLETMSGRGVFRAFRDKDTPLYNEQYGDFLISP